MTIRKRSGMRMTLAGSFALLPWWAALAAEPAPDSKPARPRDRIVAAVPADFPPTYSRNRVTGKPEGFAIDVLNGVAQRAGFEVEYVLGKPWDELHAMVLQGKADVIPNLTINQARRRMFLFTREVEVPAFHLISRATDRTRNGLTPGTTVGVIRGSTGEEQLSDRPDIAIVRYDGMQELLMDLLAGQVDLILAATPNVLKLASDAGIEERLRVIEPPVCEGKRAMAVRPGEEALRDRLNVAIDAYMNSSAYRDAYARWWGKPSPYWTGRRVARDLGIAFVAVVVLLLVWRHRGTTQANRRLSKAVAALEASQTALRESEERYRLLADFTYDWEFWIGPDGRLLYNSPSCERMTGYPAEEFVRDPALLTTMIHPDDRDAYVAAHEGEQPQLHILVFRIRTRSGGERFIEHLCRPVYRHDGSYGGRRGSNRDVTERQRAEEALHRHVRETSALNQLARRISESLSVDEVVQAALDGVTDTIRPDLVLLFARHDEELRLLGCRASEPRFRHATTPVHRMGECLCGAAAKEGRPVYVRDIRRDPRCTWEECRKAGILSFAAIPLWKGETILGVLGVASGTTERDFGEQATLIETMASEIAVGLHNAMLFDDTSRQRTELAKVNDELRAEIAERALAETRLAQTQSLLTAAVEQSPAGILIADAPDVRIRIVNSAALGIRGESHMALTDIPVERHPQHWQVYRPDGTPFPPEELPLSQAVLRGTVSRNVEAVIRRQDGEARWILANAAPVRDAEGRIIAGIVVFADITERKRAEDRLRSTVSLLQATLESTADGILVVNDAGGIEGFNTKFLELWRIPRSLMESGRDDEAIAFVLDQLKDPAQFLAKVRELYAKPDAESHDVLAFKDGRIFERFSQPQRIGEKPVGRVWSFRNVTEQRRAEAERERLRHLLSNIIDSMPSVLVGVDAEGRVTNWNREAHALTGVSARDAEGRPLQALFPQIAEQMEKVRTAIRERVAQRSEKVHLRRNGESRVADVVVYPLIANGVEGAVVRVDDVTDRVRIEEMMIQSEKMASVGSLAAGMAHEINNPLGVILQGVQNIQRRISPDLPRNVEVASECGVRLDAMRAYLERREVLSMVDHIRSAGERAAKIIANMLQFSRRSVTRMAPADLPELIDRALALAASDYDLKKQYDFRRIEIVRDFDPTLPAVPCAATEIEQVLLNLLKNAAQAMAGSVASARIVVRTRREGDWARIEVEDNGPGMTEEVRRRIFEPFFTTKEVGAGTGLGLSVSYMIITNNHKGGMAVESEPGNGTRFVIRLPLGARGA